MQIENIIRLGHIWNRYSYSGLLKNEKKFNLNQTVFCVYKGLNIFKGRIIGIEITQEDNEYLYKVEIPEETIRELTDYPHPRDFHGRKDFKDVVVNCDYIFDTVEDAKQSALKSIKHKYEVSLNLIERYFKQFE